MKYPRLYLVVFLILEGMLMLPALTTHTAHAAASSCPTNVLVGTGAADFESFSPYGVSAYQTVYGSEICGSSNRNGSAIWSGAFVAFGGPYSDWLQIGRVQGVDGNGNWMGVPIHFCYDKKVWGTYYYGEMSTWSGQYATSGSTYNFTAEHTSGNNWEVFVMESNGTTIGVGNIPCDSSYGSYTQVQLESHNYANLGSAYYSSIMYGVSNGQWTSWTVSQGWNNDPYYFYKYSANSYYFYTT